MIMAGSFIDEVFIIVPFTALARLAQGGSITPIHFLTIPTAIIWSLAGGAMAGLLLCL